MSFFIGDTVLFKSEDQHGIITKLNSPYKVTVKTSDGFEVLVSIDDLVRIEEGTNHPDAYGSNFHIKDFPKTINKSNKDKTKDNLSIKIDLHIELLTTHFNQMSNFEIVKLQLDFCHKKINEFMNSKYHTLIIVHGIGSGLLKREVHKLLNNYQLRFFLSKDGGSTQVIL